MNVDQRFLQMKDPSAGGKITRLKGGASSLQLPSSVVISTYFSSKMKLIRTLFFQVTSPHYNF
jgi:hypothetical protein